MVEEPKAAGKPAAKTAAKPAVQTARKDPKGLGSGRRRRGAVLSVLAGCGIAVVAGAVVAAGSVTPQISAAATVKPPVAALPAGQSVTNCPGPALLLDGSTGGTDPQFSAASSSSSSAVTAMVLSSAWGILPHSILAPLPGGTPLATLASAPDAGSASTGSTPSTVASPSTGAAGDQRKAVVLGNQAVSDASVLRADPVDAQRAAVGAVMSYSAADGDLAGLAVAGCQQPSNDLWLAGASTTVGRTAVLNISNSSQTAATVNLDLYGDDGPLQAPGAKGLLVPPGTNRAVVLAGLASGQSGLSVHLKSTGGPVAATVQQSVLRGLTAGGVDVIAPANVPAARQVITGVAVQDPALAASLAAQSGYADAAAALQVTVPGTADALVQVKVYGSGGQQPLPNGGVFTVKAGAVSELALTGLPAGTYTLDVGSDISFTATARVVSGLKTGDAVDFGYSAAGAKLGDGQLITVPQGPVSALSFGVPAGRAKVSLTPVTAAGKLLAVKTVDVAGGTTVTVDPAQLAGEAVAGFILSATGDAVYGAQVLGSKDKAAVSVLGVPRGVSGPQDLKVVLGY
ncbi:DUF5719 family protein [Arthrobacter sp. A5]|uniref:DUF5719 family protein n=1 Tax=Arthrobacter sp. A5 TaxID=576926 RepID=UPI003DA8FB65